MSILHLKPKSEVQIDPLKKPKWRGKGEVLNLGDVPLICILSVLT